MTNFELNNTDDVIDLRDVIERFEELESRRDDIKAEFEESPENEGLDFLNILRNHPDFSSEETDELLAIEALLSELCGNGGDEQWRGDWYPIGLIRDSHFNDYMDEMLEDCGDLPKDFPCYLSITVDYEALQMDYSSVEIDGVTYWYR